MNKISDQVNILSVDYYTQYSPLNESNLSKMIAGHKIYASIKIEIPTGFAVDEVYIKLKDLHHD